MEQKWLAPHCDTNHFCSLLRKAVCFYGILQGSFAHCGNVIVYEVQNLALQQLLCAPVTFGGQNR